MRDNLGVAPLSLPPKSSRKSSPAAALASAPTEPQASGARGAGSAMRKLLPLASKHKTRASATPSTRAAAAAAAAAAAEQRTRAAGKSYPSPLEGDVSVPEAKSCGDALREDQPRQSSRPRAPAHISASLNANAIRRKPAPTSAHAGPASDPLLPSTPPAGRAGNAESLPSSAPSPCPVRPDPTCRAQQPSSRFSMTTCATSNPGGSPGPGPSSEKTPSPPTPQPPAVGVLDRTRPVASRRTTPSGSQEPTLIALSSARKPTEPPPPHGTRHLLRHSPHNRSVSEAKPPDCRASILSTASSSMSKPLPPAPPEMSPSNDRITHLKIQSDALLHRRVNIQRIIKQMTELMPQDNLLASDEVLRRREEEKQKVEKLRRELADVQREEHQLGLQLHRAYKRQDKDAEYEPTTLWVRRLAA
ncbi:hypothetical protein UVI_02020890 [Ustilaginoidea virens]|nr:hypothetical protein UVI_02020890 [Ustilaginoidea virens]